MAKSTRNEFEFMSMVLDALGVEYEEADIKVRERWRGKVLDGWGVDYVVDDLKQFARWRQKCLEGLAKNHGGGGISWTVLYDGMVSMAQDEDYGCYSGNVPDVYTDVDQIRVTYDGVTYVLNKKDYHGNPIYGGYSGGEVLDFSEYPFAIKFDEENGMTVYTNDDASTHSIKVEIPQSGSSDCIFQKATVTITYDPTGSAEEELLVSFDGNYATRLESYGVHGLVFDVNGDLVAKTETEGAPALVVNANETATLEVYILKGEEIEVEISGFNGGVTSGTGSVEVDAGVAYVTGDCSITMTGVAS